MGVTVSEAVHAIVQSSKLSLGPLSVHVSALEIARRHGIHGHGVWLVEQAIVMVGARAGIGMKIGSEAVAAVTLDPSPKIRRAANSN